MIQVMILVGLLGGIAAYIHSNFYKPPFSWRIVINSVIAWSISIPLGYTFIPLLNELGIIFFFMWICIALTYIIEGVTMYISFIGTGFIFILLFILIEIMAYPDL